MRKEEFKISNTKEVNPINQVFNTISLLIMCLSVLFFVVLRNKSLSIISILLWIFRAMSLTSIVTFTLRLIMPKSKICQILSFQDAWDIIIMTYLNFAYSIVILAMIAGRGHISQVPLLFPMLGLLVLDIVFDIIVMFCGDRLERNAN